MALFALTAAIARGVTFTGPVFPFNHSAL